LRPAVDRIFQPRKEARANELAEQHQQLQAEHEQQAQGIRAAGEQKIAAEVAHAEAQQADVRQQTQAQVNQVREQWQADNARLQKEQVTLAQTQRDQVEQEIQGVVQTHEQKSDQILTKAEREAESERRAAEAEAAEVRRRAEAEAAARRSQQGVVQRQPAAGPVNAGPDPIAEAQLAIAAIFGKMRATIQRIISTGRDSAARDIEIARALAEKEIHKFKAKLHKQLEKVFKEYPLLALHAEMKIDDLLKQAVQDINRIASDAKKGCSLDSINQDLQVAMKHYQTDCKNILENSMNMAGGGLDATETQTMVNELEADIKNAGQEEKAQRTQQVKDMLGGYGISLWFKGEVEDQNNPSWGYAESLVALTAVSQVAAQLRQTQLDDRPDLDSRTAFKEVYGSSLAFDRRGYLNPHSSGAWAHADQDDPDPALKHEGSIWFFDQAFNGENNYDEGSFKAVQNAIHELGHVFAWHAGTPYNDLDNAKFDPVTGTTDFPRRTEGNDGFALGPGWEQSSVEDSHEEFADMFLGWAYNEWETDPTTSGLTEAGQMRSEWMNSHMLDWIKAAKR
jgi:hypothetical protein